MLAKIRASGTLESSPDVGPKWVAGLQLSFLVRGSGPNGGAEREVQSQTSLRVGVLEGEGHFKHSKHTAQP